MIAFHSVLPDVAAREVRFVRTNAFPEALGAGLPADEYAFLEFYCEDLACDCRRVFIQVVAQNQPGKVFASINYGWEPKSFYEKRIAWDRKAARSLVRGMLDPINAQSPFSEFFLKVFQDIVLDDEYRLRLARHSGMLREAIAQRLS